MIVGIAFIFFMCLWCFLSYLPEITDSMVRIIEAVDKAERNSEDE